MARLTSDGLLKTAEKLIPAGRGRPSEADLRRAVSTAYYAVFCALGDELAAPYEEPLRHMVRRLLSHGAGPPVLGQLTRTDQGTRTQRLRWHPDHPVCDPELLRFAKSFRLLLNARERADYDHRTSPTKRDAQAAVATAELAISQLRRAARTAPDQVQGVCIAMVAPDRSRRRLAR